MKTLYRHKKVLHTLLLAVLLMLCIGMPALAAEGEGAPADEPAQAAQDNSIGSKAIAAAIAVGLAAAGGAVGMGIATALCDRLEAGFSRVTTYASITARPFFMKRGYRALRENIVERGGVKLKNYLMEKLK